ncbi:uroporphyrinogen-III synthase [Teredinibacter haidensis]|uniref:uroporphyrinogen-III synthase n=1 Tax=Teredinibacter haidensis TaxID=2731755 RepID=UPI0009489A2F|nr:uroporphyrinogen-III synthase [Teredinibacter haidensis]
MVNKGRLRVIATRPREQNTGWCQQLEQEGFTTLSLPMLEIRAVSDSQRQQAIKQRILNFDQYSAAIFVSQNAVQHACNWLHDYWPQMPVGVQYFAIGSKTAALLRELLQLGVNDVQLASTTMNSEELLQHPQLQRLDSEKILICRGLGGRGLLAQALRSRGATVDYCELYQRALPSGVIEQLKAEHFSPANDVLTVFSGETLTNTLFAMEQSQGPELSGVIRQMPVVVPGERVAQQAQNLGFERIIVSPNASEQSMLSSLIHEFSEKLL